MNELHCSKITTVFEYAFSSQQPTLAGLFFDPFGLPGDLLTLGASVGSSSTSLIKKNTIHKLYYDEYVGQQRMYKS